MAEDLTLWRALKWGEQLCCDECGQVAKAGWFGVGGWVAVCGPLHPMKLCNHCHYSRAAEEEERSKANPPVT